MNRKQLKRKWKNYGLSCRCSYAPEFINHISGEFGIKFDPAKMIHVKNKRREFSDGMPRVDAEVFLLAICEEHKIIPSREKLRLARTMHGEGSRKELVEKAYLEGDE